MPVTDTPNGPESPPSRNMSSSTSNSNHLSGSPADQSPSSSNSDNNAMKEHTQLDFAKREISDNQGRSSYSQLSSMTAKSPDRRPAHRSRRHKHKRAKEGLKEDGDADADADADADDDDYDGNYEYNNNTNNDDDDDSIGEADDKERIRNPVGAVLRKHDQRERIGFRQPFGDAENDSESSQGHTPTDTAAHSPTDLTTSTLGAPVHRRRKHYEPARVVLHKQDLGPDWSNTNSNNGPNSEAPSRSSSIVPLSVANSPELGPRASVSLSLISSLSGSPDEHGNMPLKHLREPKQPIYVPAVLRPTDFDSYDPQVAVNNISSVAQRKPITQHWVRDANAAKCRACDKSFTWFRRRHHCRKCGGVFCAADTNHKIGLDRVLNFNIMGMPCRACDACASEFSGFCLDSPRLRDGPVAAQQPIQGPEQEEIEVGTGGDWSTF